MSNTIRQYFRERRSLAGDDHLARFEQLAESFGPADNKTKEFYDVCDNLGIDAVCSAGLSPERIMAILQSEETRDIIKNPSRWK